MNAENSKKYREAADAVWELAVKFSGYEVAEDLKVLCQILHDKAAGRVSVIITE